MSCYGKIYQNFLINEINKIYENENNISKDRFSDAPTSSTKNSNSLFFNENSDRNPFSLRNTDDEMNIDFIPRDNESNSLSRFEEMLKLSIPNNQGNGMYNNNSMINPFKIAQKNFWQEDIYSFDFQARYFLEQ